MYLRRPQALATHKDSGKNSESEALNIIIKSSIKKKWRRYVGETDVDKEQGMHVASDAVFKWGS